MVDFSAGSLDHNHVTDDQLQQLGKELKTAFSEIGFVFLKNFGMTEEEIQRVMDTSKTFFLQPDELKRPFCRKSFSSHENHGWVPQQTESLNPRRPGDLKEAFNLSSLQPDIKWPSTESLRDFRETLLSFFLRCKELCLRVLRVVAIALDLDPDVFLSAHRLIGTNENGTTLRSLFYPPVRPDAVKEGQLRCGEHSDYGSITLLFQDSEGLQVQTHSGEFITAPVIPGAVLINIADLMQRWTNDRLISVVHRVLLPSAGDSSCRQSLAFFVQPDDEALITCLDGLDKYPPVKSGDYLMQRLNASYL